MHSLIRHACGSLPRNLTGKSCLKSRGHMCEALEVPSPHSSGQACGGSFPTQQWAGLWRLLYAPAREIGRMLLLSQEEETDKIIWDRDSIISQYQHLKAVSSLTSNVFMPGLVRGAHSFCREVGILAIVGRLQMSFQKREGMLSSSECG